MRPWIAVLASFACLYGAAGVAVAAAAAHISGGGSAATAANFLLFHAGALAALATAAAIARQPLPLCLAASLIALGTALFSRDLAMRGLLHLSLRGRAGRRADDRRLARRRRGPAPRPASGCANVRSMTSSPRILVAWNLR